MYDPSKEELAKAHRLTNEAWSVVKPILTKLYKLPPGAKFTISFTQPSYANRTRDWLYKYLREMNQKSLCKICKESATILSIQHLEVFAPIFSKEALGNVEQFYLDHLVNINDEAEALALIQAALKAGEITHAEVMAIGNEWRRQNGLENEDKLSPEAKEVLSKMSDKSFLDQLG